MGAGAGTTGGGAIGCGGGVAGGGGGVAGMVGACDGGGATFSAAPQFSQNIEPGKLAVPHEAHLIPADAADGCGVGVGDGGGGGGVAIGGGGGTTGAAFNVAPQLSQKMASSTFSE